MNTVHAREDLSERDARYEGNQYETPCTLSPKLLLLKLVELWRAANESSQMAIVSASAMSMASHDHVAFSSFYETNKGKICRAVEGLLEGK